MPNGTIDTAYSD